MVTAHSVSDSVTQSLRLKLGESIEEVGLGLRPLGSLGVDSEVVLPPQSESNPSWEDPEMKRPFEGIGE